MGGAVVAGRADFEKERDGAVEGSRGWDDNTAECCQKAVTYHGGVAASYDAIISPRSRNRRPASPPSGRQACDLGHQSKQRSWLPNLVWEMGGFLNEKIEASFCIAQRSRTEFLCSEKEGTARGTRGRFFRCRGVTVTSQKSTTKRTNHAHKRKNARRSLDPGVPHAVR